ncbi:hypothetical protein NS389_09445 [Pantoea dispersa]|nr:hypothetical protein NS389_09445 [Pantoea dispersa]
MALAVYGRCSDRGAGREGSLTAGSLSAKVGAMLRVEVIIRELTAMGNLYSTASQQTATATLPMLF